MFIVRPSWLALSKYGGRAVAVGLAFLLGTWLIAGGAAQSQAPNFPLSFGGPFTLVDQDGRTRTEIDFRGRFMLIFFGYTHCPTICPTNLRVMGTALDMMGTAGARVQPIFISVDPERDTPARLKDYVANFHPRMVGLTGTEAQVRAAAKAYRVHRSKVITEDAKVPGAAGAAGAKDYPVMHGSITYLMGPEGEFTTLFPHDTKADRMAKVLAKYLAKSGS